MIRINNKEINMPQPNPQEAVVAPEQQGPPEMSPEEMQADLDQLMQQINGKYDEFKGLKQETDNYSKDAKEETLNQIFEALARAGVDGTDPEQLNQFLEKIRTTNPEQYEMFSDAISSLMGGDTSVQPGGEVGNISNMPQMEMGE